MVTRCHSRMLTAAAAALFVIATMFFASTSEADAQCNTLRVINRTTCAVTIWIQCSNGTVHGPFVAPPSSITPIPLPAGCSPLRVITLVCGNRTFVPNSGCLTNVSIANGCCANVCFNPLTCTINVDQVPGPCTCP